MVNIVSSVYLLSPGLQKILDYRTILSLNYTGIYFCVYIVSDYENFFLYSNKTSCHITLFTSLLREVISVEE